jgi:hypothetical protein
MYSSKTYHCSAATPFAAECSSSYVIAVSMFKGIAASRVILVTRGVLVAST